MALESRQGIDLDAGMTLDTWFTSRGWLPFEFQREVWRAYQAGESGLIHAATGTGKTLAAWGGPVAEWLDEQTLNPSKQVLRELRSHQDDIRSPGARRLRRGDSPALR